MAEGGCDRCNHLIFSRLFLSGITVADKITSCMYVSKYILWRYMGFYFSQSHTIGRKTILLHEDWKSPLLTACTWKIVKWQVSRTKQLRAAADKAQPYDTPSSLRALMGLFGVTWHENPPTFFLLHSSFSLTLISQTSSLPLSLCLCCWQLTLQSSNLTLLLSN